MPPQVDTRPPPPEDRLPFQTLAAFALPSIGMGYMSFLVGSYYFKYCIDVLVVDPAVVGMILGLSRWLEGVLFLFVGYLSDCTRSRMGRRCSWLAASSLPAAVAFFMLWNQPQSLTPEALAVWIGLASGGYSVATTAYSIPHAALGAELSTDRHERTLIAHFSQTAMSIGMLTGIIMMGLLIRFTDQRWMVLWISGLGSLGFATFVLISAFRMRERKEYHQKAPNNPWKAVADVFKNPQGRLLLLVIFVQFLGWSVMVSLTPHYSEYVLQTPGRTAWYVGLYSILSFASMWIYLPMSYRLGKIAVWRFSAFSSSLFCAAIFLVTPDRSPLFFVFLAGLGLTAGCARIVIPSLLADAVDIDELFTSQRKEGMYMAAAGVVLQVAGGIAIWGVGAGLNWAGFRPNSPQSPQTVQIMRAFYSLIPASCHLIAAVLLLYLSYEPRRAAGAGRPWGQSGSV